MQAYPLSWPSGFPRTERRMSSQFKTSLTGALKNVRSSITAFAKDSGKPATGIILSSNCTLGDDRPADPGVAVWFTWDGIQVCIPVDRYVKVEENLQAIHHVLEARRTEMRHGGLHIARATFMGFTALPPPSSHAGRDWRTVLGVPAGDSRLSAATDAWKALQKRHHPDKNGSAEIPEFREAKDAYDQACRELGNPG